LSRGLLVLAILLLGACVSIPERASGSFVERSIDVAGTTHRYQVFVPASAAGGRTPPVIVFLHGSGERGDDGAKQTQVGIGPYIRAHLNDFPAIVVFP
ncbi:MAG: phospholipase, partial [Thermomonas sp.]